MALGRTDDSGRRCAADHVAVLYCDVDRFKEINDTLGHAVGDRLLVEISRRLRRTAREQDVAARFGGDEFVLVAYPMTAAAADDLAERLIRAVREPVPVGEGVAPIVPAVSIGVAISTHLDSADDVLAAADRALYQAKAAGR